MFGYLVALAVVALIATVVVLLATFRQVARATPSPRLLLRVYLEAAAFTGVLFLVVELVGPIQWLLASTFGLDAVYGAAPLFQTPPPSRQCAPPNAPMCQPADVQLQLWLADRDRTHFDNLVRGGVFGTLAAVFSGVHFGLRFVLLRGDERGGLLHRAHLVIALLTFGFITALYLPSPLVQLIDHLAYPTSYDARSGVGVALPFGLSSLLAWLVYAALLIADLRPEPAPRPDPNKIPVW